MNLLDLQRRMAEDVRRPLTADYEMQRTTEGGGSTEELVASYIAPNSRLSSFERLEIYNRQYWFRLMSAVSEDYPSLNAVVGPKRFESLILAYLHAHPSTSWTLRDLGAKLPAFLVEHPELAGRRHKLADDVAKLEWAYVDAFDSKRLEPLAPEEAQRIGPDSQLFLQPHVQLLELTYPVDTLVLAVKKGKPETDIVSSAASQKEAQYRVKLPPMRQQRVYLAVHRSDESVYYRRIEREVFLILSALRSGSSVAESIASGFAHSRLNPDEQAALIQQCFAHAAELGWFCNSEVISKDRLTSVM
jgi:hypothetical protein